MMMFFLSVQTRYILGLTNSFKSFKFQNPTSLLFDWNPIAVNSFASTPSRLLNRLKLAIENIGSG